MTMNKIQSAASTLGSIRTEKKAKASRINGTRPCAPGKRRGRPRKKK
jgi:hypothetical protein